MQPFWEHRHWHGNTQRMKIGFDAKRLYNNFTGLGNHSRTTIDILTEFFPNNEYVLYTPSIKADAQTLPYQSKPGCSTITPNGVLPKGIWRTFSLGRIATQDKADLFHGLSNELPAGLGIPSVVTIHDVAFRTFPDMYHMPDRFTYNLKWKHACNAASRIIAISQATKLDILKYYNVDPDKIDVVYQPVSPMYYTDFAGTCPAQIKAVAEGLPYMLYVGSINSRKNLLGAVKAIEMLPKDIQIPLVVIGNGREYKKTVFEYIESHGLQDLVIFPQEKVSPQELRYLYCNAQLLVYPSFCEGFGLPVVEALLSHCPVVTSNISSLPESAGPYSQLVSPQDTGQISDSLRSVLTDSSLRAEMIVKSYAYAVDSFSPKVLAQSLVNTYNACCGQ